MFLPIFLSCLCSLTCSAEVKEDQLLSNQELRKLMSRVAALEQENVARRDENQRLLQIISEDRFTGRSRRAENEVTVAFFAGLTQHIQHAAENQNVVFDLVETNLATGYNPQNGVFTAPVRGVYVFTTAIMTNSGRKICELVVNGVRKAQVYTHGDGHYDHGSQTIVVELKPGDTVEVQVVEHNFDSTIHGEGVPYTTFSGFLLQQDYSQSSAVIG